MKLLTIYNQDLSVEVLYLTDLITDTQSNFTVMEIRGLDDAEKQLGIDFKKLSYSVEEFKAFCTQHELGLKSKAIGTTVDHPEQILVEPKEEVIGGGE